MDDFFITLLSGENEKPAEIYNEVLMQICPEASLIEWFIDGSIHEAIFVERGQEKIARFTKEAELMDLRINLHLYEVPENIREIIESYGEIMSSILIKEESEIKYEFVLRDAMMKREIIFIDEHGKILSRHDFPEII